MDENLNAWVRFVKFTAQRNASVLLGNTTLFDMLRDRNSSTNLINWSNIEGQTKMTKQNPTANNVKVNRTVDAFSDSATLIERDLLLPLLTLAPVPLPPRRMTALDDLW